MGGVARKNTSTSIIDSIFVGKVFTTFYSRFKVFSCFNFNEVFEHIINVLFSRRFSQFMYAERSKISTILFVKRELK